MKTGQKQVIYCKVAQCNFAEVTCNQCWKESCKKISDIIKAPEQLRIDWDNIDI